jgi:hypothetical protein
MTRLSGWGGPGGRLPGAGPRAARRTWREAMAEGPLIARGNGRSYGDPAMSPG